MASPDGHIEVIIDDEEEGGDDVFILESPTSPETVPPKRKRLASGRLPGETAIIWQFFEYRIAEDASQCKSCNKLVPKRDISNNIKHLKFNHPTLYEEYMSLQSRRREMVGTITSPTTTPKSTGRQLTLQESRERSAKYMRDNPRQQDISILIARLFAAHSLPLRLADCQIWRQLLSTMDHRYVPAARDGVRRRILEETAKLRRKIEEELAIVRKLSICVDLWSKKSLTSSFVGVTGHFFSPTRHRLVRVFLGVEEIRGSHTAEAIYAIVEKVLDSWKIEPSKVRCFVTDNGSNVVKAFRDVNEDIRLQLEDVPAAAAATAAAAAAAAAPLPPAPADPLAAIDGNLEEEEPEEEDDFDSLEVSHYIQFGRQKRIACFAHLIVNTLKHTIESSQAYNEILKRATDLIRSFTTSTRRVGLILDRAGRRLISPSRTRWLYAFFMLQRLLELKDYVQVIMKEDDIDVYLTKSHWRQIELLVGFLQVFAQLTTYVEGESYSTINSVVPALLEMLAHCEEYKDVEMFATMADKVAEEIRYRFSVVLDHSAPGFQPIFCVATLMDPDLRRVLSMCDLFESAKAELIRMGRALMNNRMEAIVEEAAADNVALTMTSKAVQFRRIFQKLSTTQTHATIPSQVPVSEEVEKYLKEESSMGAVEFWRGKEASKEYPILCSIAWEVLSVPATSAPIERVFSHAGIASGGRRSRINPDLLNAELQMNLNYYFFE